MATGVAVCGGLTRKCGRHASATGHDTDAVLEALGELTPEDCPGCGRPVPLLVDSSSSLPAVSGMNDWVDDSAFEDWP